MRAHCSRAPVITPVSVLSPVSTAPQSTHPAHWSIPQTVSVDAGARGHKFMGPHPCLTCISIVLDQHAAELAHANDAHCAQVRLPHVAGAHPKDPRAEPELELTAAHQSPSNSPRVGLSSNSPARAM